MSALTFSKRAEEIPFSPIRKLFPLVRGREKEGIKVFHLSLGQPDVPSPSAFFEGIQSFREDPVAYAPSGGMEELVEAWQGFYQRSGYNIDEKEILVTNGASEAYSFALAAICDPGDDVLVIEPYYANYFSLAKLLGINLRAVSTESETGFDLPPVSEIAAALGPKTKALVINTPCNPSGAVYSKGQLQELATLAKEKGFYIISDEVYRNFAYEGDITSFLDYPEIADRVIVLDSVSKTFSLCGARVGVLISRNRALVETIMKFCMARLSVASLEQAGVISVLKHSDQIIPAAVEEYRSRRDTAFETLSAIEGVKVLKPRGAFYILPQLPVQSTEKFCSWMATDFEDSGETVLLAPGPGFYLSPGRGQNEVRLAFVVNSQSLRRVAVLIEKGLQQYCALEQ